LIQGRDFVLISVVAAAAHRIYFGMLAIATPSPETIIAAFEG
jgi:hypothetical protein